MNFDLISLMSEVCLAQSCFSDSSVHILFIMIAPAAKIPVHVATLTSVPTDGPYFSKNVSSKGRSGTS